MLATLHISYKGVQKIFEIFVQTFLLKILDIYDDLHYMYNYAALVANLVSCFFSNS